MGKRNEQCLVCKSYNNGWCKTRATNQNLSQYENCVYLEKDNISLCSDDVIKSVSVHDNEFLSIPLDDNNLNKNSLSIIKELHDKLNNYLLHRIDEQELNNSQFNDGVIHGIKCCIDIIINKF